MPKTLTSISVRIALALASSVPAAAQTYQGWLDAANCSTIQGWAWDATLPNTPISVDISVEDSSGRYEPLATIVAGNFRQDLLNAGIGNGYHGFSFTTPGLAKNGQPLQVVVKFAGTTINLSGSPSAAMTCPAVPRSYYSDSLTSINTTNWTQNGSLTPTTGGLTAPAAGGGSLISKLAIPDGTADAEVDLTVDLAASGGTYIAYLRASPDAMSGPSTAAGTYYSFELRNPTWSGSSCSATLAITKRVNGAVTLLESTPAGCHSTSLVQVFVHSTTLLAFVDGINVGATWDSSIASGQPGVGAYGTPSGAAITQAALIPMDRIAPAAVQNVASSVSPNRVDLQWQGAVDDPNGSGIWCYLVWRNGAWLATAIRPEWTDETVAPSTTYTYSISAVDLAYNYVSPTTVTVVTPAAGAVDPRRVGVRPDGAYWGGAGEQIDALSGNLNFSSPLLKAMGRGGWSVPFGLSYNAQQWRQDGGGTWNLGRDVGYGYGWKLQAGSITPYWAGYYTIDHYLYVDSTGAQYRLDQNNNNIWTSKETGVYVEYDANANKLYFPDGSFWVMGAVSSGLEQDAGTQYPTSMEDTNGNQITVLYDYGAGVMTPNSSARIASIQDVRTGQYTFGFVGTGLPHLDHISNTLGTAENYHFTIPLASLSDPFAGASFGSAGALQTLSQDGTGLTRTFSYDGSGEMTQVVLPYGGSLQWGYRSFTYSGSSNRTLREVLTRTLTQSAGATPEVYNFYHDDVSSQPVHQWAGLVDPSGPAKFWSFNTTTAPVGFISYFDDRSSLYGTTVRDRTMAYAQDTAGRWYTSGILTTLDPGQSYQQQSQSTQVLDAHGNVTQSKIYNYGNLSSPARTYTNTYLTSTNYTSLHIWNRLLTSAVTDGTNNVTLATNTYDGGTLTNIASLPAHDPTYSTTFTYRGNVTQILSPGSTRNVSYDIGGNAVSSNDGNGHTLATTFSTATQYSAPDALTPNSNSNLATSLTYTSFLGVSSVTAPGSSASITYDAYGRPSTSTSPYGAVTTYTYNANNVNVVTATTGTRIVTTTLDGLGRAVRVATGDSNGVQTQVDTTYGPCACSPLGKMTSVSRPYAPGATVYWTTYTYDALGRTISIALPGGDGTTTYSYQGNTTTVTDPAGKWKTYTSDAMGNLIQVTEPAPEGGTHQSSYAYNLLNQMTTVTMPRTINSQQVTQTRTFNYSLTTGRLASATNPENGTVSYTYNSDGTLAQKTDAKNQQIQYTYDTYGRVTEKRDYASSGTEDLPNRVDYTYNTLGQLASAQWGQSSTIGQFLESYTYAAGGLLASKTLQLTQGGIPGSQTVSFSYNPEGQLAGVSLPQFWLPDPPGCASSPWCPEQNGPSYVYSFDTLGRPNQLTENWTTQSVLVNNVSYGGPAGQLSALTWGMPSMQPYYGDIPQYNETRSYNARGQMTSLQYTGVLNWGYPTLPNVNLTYTYSPTNNDGRITQMTNGVSGEVVNYQYDSLGRLTLAQTVGTQWGQSFGYDGFGNLTSEVATQGTAFTSYQNYDATTNRIVGGGTSYDANGNLTAMPTLTLSYDEENRLVQSVQSLNGSEQYVYNPSGQLVYRQNNTATEVYMYGVKGERIRFDLVLPSWYDGNLLLFTYVDQELYFAGKLLEPDDRLGTNLAASSPYGQSASTFPYGELREAPAAGDRFATYLLDTTSNLNYARHRWYSSQVARFTTADPYMKSARARSPQSWNRYAYVGGDPINRIDPSGRCEGEARMDGDDGDDGDSGDTDCPEDGGGGGGGGSLLGTGGDDGGGDDAGDGGGWNPCSDSGDNLFDPGDPTPNPACYAAVPPPPPPPQPDCDQILTADLSGFLGGYDGGTSPLDSAANIQTLVSAGMQYDVDPRFIVALSVAESQAGTHLTWGPYNAWNIRARNPNYQGSGKQPPYTSWSQSINGVTGLIAGRQYFKAGLTATSTIYSKYQGPGYQTGLGNLNTALGQMYGNQNVLTDPCNPLNLRPPNQ
jgi:RHS repeat-associated protein